MKNLIFIIFIAFVFSLISFYLVNFFIPDVMVIKNNPSFIFDPSVLKKKEPVFLKLFEETKEMFIFHKIDFLEVNLDEMKMRPYKKGIMVKEVPILTKGDPQGWGGSAVGLYKIMSGNEISFSVVSDVYMPHALRYYGKYYLHGEPYYSWGGKLISSVSGGCLRLNNEDAKVIYELTELDMPVLVIDKEKDSYEYPKKKLSEFPEISAQSYLVADLDSGYVFAEKDSQKQLQIASLTKLMTAVVVAENIDLRKSILVKGKMLEAYGSTVGLESGKWFRVVELFYPLLIESSNDAAEALSYFLGREKTIKLMNEKAKAILMRQTKFVDPSGFDPENIATARDIFYLARYLLNNRPPILEITKGKEVATFGKLDFKIKDLWNKNVFINDPTFVGGKTGFIRTSQYTALFIFRLTTEDGLERNIAIIFLGSENNKADTQKIYIWLQENYFKKIESVVENDEFGEVKYDFEIAPDTLQHNLSVSWSVSPVNQFRFSLKHPDGRIMRFKIIEPLEEGQMDSVPISYIPTDGNIIRVPNKEITRRPVNAPKGTESLVHYGRTWVIFNFFPDDPVLAPIEGAWQLIVRAPGGTDIVLGSSRIPKP